MTSSTFIKASVLLILTCGVYNPAHARFVLEDAETVDKEERINTETYNDKISYRFPDVWAENWRRSQTAFRMNAGSLNVREFDYQQEVKLHSGWNSEASMEFRQRRQEDFIESYDIQEIRLTKHFKNGAYLSLLGDGGTQKEYGDIGFATGVGFSSERFVEFYYWSVDHYYKTKKRLEEDSRSSSTETYGLDWNWSFESVHLRGDVESDTPMVWDRRSEGYLYKYSRTRGQIVIEKAIGANFGFSSYDFDHKRESKGFRGSGGNIDYEKIMKRHTYEVEAGYKVITGVRHQTIGFQNIFRDADYTFLNDAGISEDDFLESIGAEYSTRNENGLYYTDYDGVGSDFYQWGVYFNQVRVDQITYDQNGVREETEVKLGLAYERRVTDDAKFLINTTWDIDRIFEDAPYYDNDFKPWGGGNLQFQAEF